jgi:hypothetical protein
MAKPKGRGKAPQPARKAGSRPAAEQLPSDDELDAFQKQRDKISLDASDDVMSEGGLDEEAVYDLSGDESEDLEDSDEEDDIEAAIAKGGSLAESEQPMRRAAAPCGPPPPRCGMLAARRGWPPRRVRPAPGFATPARGRSPCIARRPCRPCCPPARAPGPEPCHRRLPPPQWPARPSCSARSSSCSRRRTRTRATRRTIRRATSCGAPARRRTTRMATSTTWVLCCCLLLLPAGSGLGLGPALARCC